MQPAVELSNRHIPRFTVITPRIRQHVRSFKFELRCQLKRKLAFPEIAMIFVWIEADFQLKIVCTIR